MERIFNNSKKSMKKLSCGRRDFRELQAFFTKIAELNKAYADGMKFLCESTIQGNKYKPKDSSPTSQSLLTNVSTIVLDIAITTQAYTQNLENIISMTERGKKVFEGNR